MSKFDETSALRYVDLDLTVEEGINQLGTFA